MVAPRARADSSVSITNTPAPSPSTMPRRPLEDGRQVSGAMARIDSQARQTKGLRQGAEPSGNRWGGGGTGGRGGQRRAAYRVAQADMAGGGIGHGPRNGQGRQRQADVAVEIAGNRIEGHGAAHRSTDVDGCARCLGLGQSQAGLAPGLGTSEKGELGGPVK